MASCKLCESQGLNHDKIVAACESSPYWVGRLIIGFDWFENPFHKHLADWFTARLAAGKKRFFIMTPRDHLKTSLFGISLLTWRALIEPEDRLLYIMANCTEAEKTLRVVRDLFMNNDKIAHFFPKRTINPNMMQSMGSESLHQRSTGQFLGLPREGVYREGSVEARGVDSRMTGGHFNWHVFDDLIDEQMANSVVTQNAVVDFVKRSDALFVQPAEDIEIIIGTRWPGPFYKWLIDESGLIDTYETAILGCYVDDRYRHFLGEMGMTTVQEDGEPIWPEHFSKEALERIALRAGPFDFAHQWLNLHVAEEDRRFNREDFQYYNIDPQRDKVHFKVDGITQSVYFKDMYISMTIDPATGEGERTDESAITVCGYDSTTGAIFCLEDWSGRALPFELIKKICEIARHWPTLASISPEDVSYQKTLKHFLRAALMKNHIHVPVRPVKPGSKKGKGTRILDALQPFVANHQFFVLRKMRKMVDELVNMQVVDGKVVGRSPNLADALAYHAPNWRAGFSYQLDENESEIAYVDPFWTPEPTGPAYGLECST